MTHDEIYDGRVARDERNYNSDTSNYSKTANPIMTHEEILLKLSSTNRRYGATQDNSALRAVVELHKPVLDTYTTPLDLDPPEVRERYECGICCVYYPCQTIQAIEKELK